MEYKIKIDSFEGPMDLLLHLLKKNKVEIVDVKISAITKQYLEYIAKMNRLNLNIASEFLLMATKLIEIKSKTLLPNLEEDEEEDDEATKEELVEKLLEYKKYKELATQLKELESTQQKSYASNVKPLLSTLNLEQINPLEDIKAIDLAQAFEKVLREKLKRANKKEAAEQEKRDFLPKIQEKITIKSQQSYIRNKIAIFGGQIKFKKLFTVDDSKFQIIVTFMALLELIRMNEVEIKQKDNFAEIKIYHNGGSSNYAQSS